MPKPDKLTRVTCPIEGRQVDKSACWGRSQNTHYNPWGLCRGCKSQFRLCHLCVRDGCIDDAAVVNAHATDLNRGLCTWHIVNGPGRKRPKNLPGSHTNGATPVWKHSLLAAQKQTGHSILDLPLPPTESQREQEEQRPEPRGPEVLVPLILNEQDLIKQAEFVQELLEYLEDMEEVSKACGRSLNWGYTSVRLLELPAEVQQAISDGVIPVTAGRALFPVKDEEVRERLGIEIVAGKMNVAEARHFVAEARGKLKQEKERMAS